jgi:hypothetical protein
MRLALALALAVACKSGESWEELLAELDGFRKQMCACTTKDCAEKVTAEHDAWKNATGNPAIARQPGLKVPAPYGERWMEIELDLISCRYKLIKPAGT